jgi:hypothetical protein
MDENKFSDFISLSVLLTGFKDFQLHGTGMATIYYETLCKQIGEQLTHDYLVVYATIQKQSGNDEHVLNKLFRKNILCDEKFGPVTRNVIKMWFVGTWYELPREGYAKYGPSTVLNKPFVVSTQAYTEGLLWPAIGSHPAGAKGPGYGTWYEKPVFENI